MNAKRGFVLGIHPTSHGFGWALFEGPLAPFDWGAAAVTKNKHAETLARVGKLLARYRPAVLALEQYEGDPAHRTPRIQRIAHGLVALADEHGIEVVIYSRAAIRAAFASTGARSREAIAAAIAEHLPALRPRLPKKRKVWIGEHPSMSLFCAAACALTWYGESGA